jgi:mannose-1-phosphate guanylyltransferase
MTKKPNVFVVIMAGGGGTRFWPWSREQRPKQLLPIVSDRSMIWETVERIRPLVPVEKIFLVTSRSQAKDLSREVPQIPRKNLLLEPVGRNTAPCLCLAAWHLQKLDSQAVMVVLPADHWIADRRGLRSTLRRAVSLAARENYLVTLGIRPATPETGYGYIQKGKILGKVNDAPVFQVKAFREKPSRSRARSYLRTGNYLWNSGMFIWKVTVFLHQMQRYLPRIHQEIAAVRNGLGTPRGDKLLERIYPRFPSISVDYGILEKAKNVAVMEAPFRWDDMGSWAALRKIHPQDGRGNTLIPFPPSGQGKILVLESSGCLIRGEEKLIAVLGMKDTIVVEAGNALLVCPLDRSQEVRQVLQALQDRGWKEWL